jgi:hypothetical protein
MDAVKLRAWWAHRQGLDGSLAAAAPASVLARTGWARSVGGVNPYLQMFSRAGIRREEADAAMAELAIHELPSARGCVYVLPAADFAVALRVGESGALPDVATCEKLGVPRAEIDKLCAAVLDALDEAGGPLAPKDIREIVGEMARDLGEAGKKKGLTSTLPVALGLLQASGDVRRVPIGGRLDVQRYRYVRWSPSPLAGVAPTAEEARAQLALRYWAWTGGASMAHFRWFSGFTAANAKAAVQELHLVPLEGDLLAFPEDADAYAEFSPPSEPRYSLVSWLDGLTLLRRDLPSVLDPADAERQLPAPISMTTLSGLGDLPAQGIFDRGRLVGLWEYDTDEQRVVWVSFGPDDDGLRAAVAETERFVRDDLGDAKGSSLDNPAKRKPRLAALREYAGS